MKRLFYATLFSVVTLFGMSAQANLQPLVVVKLNGYETISLKDLKDSVETYQSQSGQKFNIEQKKEILESLTRSLSFRQQKKKESFFLTVRLTSIILQICLRL